MHSTSFFFPNSNHLFVLIKTNRVLSSWCSTRSLETVSKQRKLRCLQIQLLSVNFVSQEWRNSFKFPIYVVRKRGCPYHLINYCGKLQYYNSHSTITIIAKICIALFSFQFLYIHVSHLVIKIIPWGVAVVQLPSHVWLFATPMDWSTTGLPVPHHLPSLPSSCPLHRWCHPAILSSDIFFSFCPQSFPASGTFPMSRLFSSDDQNTGASASASVLPTNIQGWFHLGLTSLVSLLSKGLAGVFSSTTVWRHQFFGTLPLHGPALTTIMWPLGRP